MIMRFILSLVLLLCSSAHLFSKESFDSSVLCLLDENEHTYLFRGNIPQRDGVFCYEELREAIQKYLRQYGRQVSPGFKLICVSLLNNFADSKESRVEAQWFACHSDKGWMWRYPLFGYGCSPCYIPKHLRQPFYSTDVDGVRCFLHHLKMIFDYDYGEDVVIYMHCKAGKDRTGEASACYLMQCKGYSYREALCLSQQIARRKLRLMSIHAIRWHASYLKEVCHLPTIGEIE